jgi:guanine deaminase
MMNKFMQLAIEEAKEGIRNKHGGPFGAVIVKDGEVIASAHNKVLLNNDPTCHGEIEAIRKACKVLNTYDLEGCEIYTTHYPCPMCECAIRWANINKIYYGCCVKDTDALGFRDLQFYDSEFTKYEQVDKQGCIELSKTYQNMNHILY